MYCGVRDAARTSVRLHVITLITDEALSPQIVNRVMNFGRDVARQTSCYTYVVEDEDPALASLNAIEVKGNKYLKPHLPNLIKRQEKDLLCNHDNMLFDEVFKVQKVVTKNAFIYGLSDRVPVLTHFVHFTITIYVVCYKKLFLKLTGYLFNLTSQGSSKDDS